MADVLKSHFVFLVKVIVLQYSVIEIKNTLICEKNIWREHMNHI